MKNVKSIRVLDLLSRRERLFLLGGYVLVVLAISAPLEYFEVMEVHYQFGDRAAHHVLDDFMVTGVIALLVLSAFLVAVALRLGKRLLVADAERTRLQHSIEQTRQLVAMGKVLGGVSHSVNNHLLPVIALTEEALVQLDERSEVAQDLHVVLDAARSAAHILKQLKNFSRQEMALRETCELQSGLAKALGLCEKIIPSSVQLYKDIEPLEVRVALSEVSLEIVLLNLVSNAVDAIGSSQGSIAISLMACEMPVEASDALRAFSSWVSLRVEDSGAGMTPEQMDRVFDPFYTTKPEGRGTGLGLSESYGIVKAAGGFIHVESVERFGSAFVVRLPVLLNEGRQGNSRFMPL